MAKKLIQAADFPVIVELKLSSKGKWHKYACMRNAGVFFAKENQESLDLNCGSSSYSDTVAEMKLEMFRVLNSDILGILTGAKTTVIPAGVYSVNEKHTFGSDRIIVLPYTSNDNNGVTSIVVTLEDGTTVNTSEYTVTTANNKTEILGTGATIPAGTKVKITGTVNLNATKKVVTKLGTGADEKIDVRFVGMKNIQGADYNFSIEATEGSNTSGFNIEFLNKIKGGLPKGSETTFKFDSNEVVMLDEISPKEETL